MITALDRCVGHRKRDDRSEPKAPVAPKSFDAESEGGEAKPLPFDGEVVPNSKRVGRDYPIEPMPYADLGALVTPMARELIEELTLVPVNDEPEPSNRGGSLSVRHYVRPFLVRDAARLAPPVMAVRVVIDHSTSMNHSTGGRTRIQRAAEAAMMLHLAFVELRIDHGISVMPQHTCSSRTSPVARPARR